MENIVYERDYKEEHEKAAKQSDAVDILNQAIAGGTLQRYCDAMQAIPKIIVPEYRENYEYLLQICDRMAKARGGSIRGVVNYQKWEATIDLTLPYAEFDCPKELADLRDIAEKSHYVLFQPAKGGGIRIHIFNLYFEEMVSDDYKAFVETDAIMKDPILAEKLGMATELPPDMEAAADYINGILDMVEEATNLDRTTIFKTIFRRLHGQDLSNVLELMEQAAQDLIEENRNPDT